jgi:hypothetical protein
VIVLQQPGLASHEVEVPGDAEPVMLELVHVYSNLMDWEVSKAHARPGSARSRVRARVTAAAEHRP